MNEELARREEIVLSLGIKSLGAKRDREDYDIFSHSTGRVLM